MEEEIKLEVPDLEKATDDAFKMLAKILQQARAEKHRRMKEEMQNIRSDDKIDMYASTDVQDKLSIPMENRIKWILYPDM